MANLTRDEVIQRIRFAMGVLNIKGRLPCIAECCEYGKLSAAHISGVGGMKKLSRLMGLPMASQKSKAEDEHEGIYSMEDITPSGAFDMQRDSGMLYADIQKAATLSEVPGIDLSAYAGMTTYAERKQNELR